MYIEKFSYSAFFLVVAATFSSSAIADEIPSTFRGKWGESAKVCNPKAIEANNLVTVTAQKLIEYESSCTLKKLKSSSDSNLQGVFICSVEGEDSTDIIKMALLEEGKLLVLRDQKKLKKCK